MDSGASNVVRVGVGTAIYGVPPKGTVKQVLFTHARRDAMHMEPGTQTQFVVPKVEQPLFEHPEQFWLKLETERFHDYAQQSTKVPVTALAIARAVSGGDMLQEGDIRIRVIDTPGFTRGAVSYLIEAGGKRIACTGDLIYGNGQLFDLYSLQDAVPEAKARGYHGYAARAGDLISSLRRIADEKPDVILPSRGPLIEDPQKSISQLISRLQRFLASHFETDALRWYWGDENHRIRSGAVEARLAVMPMAEQEKLPSDIVAIGNSRLIISQTGAAFLVDAGYRKLLPELQQLKQSGKITRLDGMWITHYHDDHTDYINDIRAAFPAPVYFNGFMQEVLEKPGAFRLPCLTSLGVPIKDAKRDGETMRWNEWRFTFLYFPGQTMYHGGLVARREDGQTYLFTGDSFTPSGMDDYCMQNRDILRAGEGYEYCLRKIAGLPADTWLINQHVSPMFRFSSAQQQRMQAELLKRSSILKELTPWPDINYMVDESWARIHPYGSEIRTGDSLDLQLRIRNHTAKPLTHAVHWNVPPGITLVKADKEVRLAGLQEGIAQATVRAVQPGLQVVTADVRITEHDLKQWTEALIRVR